MDGRLRIDDIQLAVGNDGRSGQTRLRAAARHLRAPDARERAGIGDVHHHLARVAARLRPFRIVLRFGHAHRDIGQSGIDDHALHRGRGVVARLARGLGGGRALAVVSPEVGDGKSFFSANLAVALAQLGGRTLLIEPDFRKGLTAEHMAGIDAFVDEHLEGTA